MVKEFLSQKGIGYEERDVSRNQAYAQELVRTTRQMGVPVTIFDGETVIGFDRGRLEQLAIKIRANARPSFGASIADAAKITAKQGLQLTSGAYIGGVRPDSPAQRLGLEQGDIITKLNSNNISSATDLERALANLQKGSRIWVTFLRGSLTKSSEGTL